MHNTCNCSGHKWCGNHGLGMFVLRLITGIVLVYAGWYKVQNAAATVGFFGAMHLAPWVATFITWLELIGGVALILGIFTCFFASLFAIEMAVAVILSWKMGFQVAELPLLMFGALVAIKHCGRGKWGIGKRCGCLMCGMGRGGANVCPACGHDPKAGGECGCDCHK